MQRTLLKTAELGTTGLQITRVGFGAWVDAAIVGFRRPNQVDEILPAAGLDLSDEEARDLEGTLEGDLEETL